MPTPAAPAPPVATSVDSTAESATTALYRAAIGPISNDYYLPIFTRFETTDKTGPSWNSAASLYTLNWMVFRHLWKPAGLYVAALIGAALIALGAGFFLPLSETTEWGLWLMLAILSFMVPGFYGNAWLHAANRIKMAKALAASATLREACDLLNQEASSRQRFIWQVAINLVLAGLVAGGYVAFSHLGSSKPVTSPPPAKERNLTVGRLTDAPPPTMSASEPAASPASATPAAADLAAPVQKASSALAPTPAPVATATAASAPLAMKSPAEAASASPLAVPPTPLQPVPQVQDQAYLDAMAAATSRYVTRRPVIPAPQPEAPTPPTPAPAAAPPTPASQPTVTKPKDKPKAATHAAVNPHAINVGLFANESNARNAHAKLRDAGLPATLQTLETSKGQRTRVRVGPFNSRAEAETAAKKIRALQLEAVIFQPA